MYASFSLNKNIPSAILMALGSQLENWRIYLHLFRVELKLRLANTDHLSMELKQQRALNLNRLNTYRRNGVFPKNLDFPKNFIPYFKDAYDTPCAVAYLMEQSGECQTVTAVAKSCNHIYVNRIKEGPALDWIKQSGLTQKEAALIQPTYGGAYLIIIPVLYSFIPLAINFVLSGALITVVIFLRFKSRLSELKSNVSRKKFWGSMTSLALALIGFLIWCNAITFFFVISSFNVEELTDIELLIPMYTIVPLACLFTFIGLIKFLFKKSSSTIPIVLYSTVGAISILTFFGSVALLFTESGLVFFIEFLEVFF